MAKLHDFLHFNNKTEECPLEKSKASLCSTLQNNLYLSTTLSLPIDFFSKLNRTAYLPQPCPVKSKLADQSICLTALAGGKNFGGSRCYISQVAAK